MQTQILHSIPATRLATVVGNFEKAGYAVTSSQQANGTYTVTATKATITPPRTDSPTPDANTIVLNNIPANRVATVVRNFVRAGYSVTTQAEPDGEYTVIATKN